VRAWRVFTTCGLPLRSKEALLFAKRSNHLGELAHALRPRNALKSKSFSFFFQKRTAFFVVRPPPN
jgi:hypothetical protein